MHGASENFDREGGKVVGLPVRKVLLADSDPIFLHGLASAIAVDFSINSEVTTSQECLASLQNADVLVMGFSLACGRNALGLLPDIRARQPDVAVIILLSPTAAWMAPLLRSAGAKGVFSRRALPQDIPRLVSDALDGRKLPPIPRRSPREDSTAGSVDLLALSARELEIFRLIGLGKSGKNIAALLGISDKTVSAHRENIKVKLKISGSGVRAVSSDFSVAG